MKHLIFDKRLVERYVKQGITTQKDYDKYISSLKDVESNSVEIDLQDENSQNTDDSNTED